jgi:hypothetical protein
MKSSWKSVVTRAEGQGLLTTGCQYCCYYTIFFLFSLTWAGIAFFLDYYDSLFPGILPLVSLFTGLS